MPIVFRAWASADGREHKQLRVVPCPALPITGHDGTTTAIVTNAKGTRLRFRLGSLVPDQAGTVSMDESAEQEIAALVLVQDKSETGHGDVHTHPLGHFAWSRELSVHGMAREVWTVNKQQDQDEVIQSISRTLPLGSYYIPGDMLVDRNHVRWETDPWRTTEIKVMKRGQSEIDKHCKATTKAGQKSLYLCTLFDKTEENQKHVLAAMADCGILTPLAAVYMGAKDKKNPPPIIALRLKDELRSKDAPVYALAFWDPQDLKFAWDCYKDERFDVVQLTGRNLLYGRTEIDREFFERQGGILPRLGKTDGTNGNAVCGLLTRLVLTDRHDVTRIVAACVVICGDSKETPTDVQALEEFEKPPENGDAAKPSDPDPVPNPDPDPNAASDAAKEPEKKTDLPFQDLSMGVATGAADGQVGANPEPDPKPATVPRTEGTKEPSTQTKVQMDSSATVAETTATTTTKKPSDATNQQQQQSAPQPTVNSANAVTLHTDSPAAPTATTTQTVTPGTIPNKDDDLHSIKTLDDIGRAVKMVDPGLAGTWAQGDLQTERFYGDFVQQECATDKAVDKLQVAFIAHDHEALGGTRFTRCWHNARKRIVRYYWLQKNERCCGQHCELVLLRPLYRENVGYYYLIRQWPPNSNIKYPHGREVLVPDDSFVLHVGKANIRFGVVSQIDAGLWLSAEECLRRAMRPDVDAKQHWTRDYLKDACALSYGPSPTWYHGKLRAMTGVAKGENRKLMWQACLRACFLLRTQQETTNVPSKKRKRRYFDTVSLYSMYLLDCANGIEESDKFYESVQACANNAELETFLDQFELKGMEKKDAWLSPMIEKRLKRFSDTAETRAFEAICTPVDSKDRSVHEGLPPCAIRQILRQGPVHFHWAVTMNCNILLNAASPYFADLHVCRALCVPIVNRVLLLDESSQAFSKVQLIENMPVYRTILDQLFADSELAYHLRVSEDLVRNGNQIEHDLGPFVPWPLVGRDRMSDWPERHEIAMRITEQQSKEFVDTVLAELQQGLSLDAWFGFLSVFSRCDFYQDDLYTFLMILCYRDRVFEMLYTTAADIQDDLETIRKNIVLACGDLWKLNNGSVDLSMDLVRLTGHKGNPLSIVYNEESRHMWAEIAERNARERRTKRSELVPHRTDVSAESWDSRPKMWPVYHCRRICALQLLQKSAERLADKLEQTVYGYNGTIEFNDIGLPVDSPMNTHPLLHVGNFLALLRYDIILLTVEEPWAEWKLDYVRRKWVPLIHRYGRRKPSKIVVVCHGRDANVILEPSRADTVKWAKQNDVYLVCMNDDTTRLHGLLADILMYMDLECVEDRLKLLQV